MNHRALRMIGAAAPLLLLLVQVEARDHAPFGAGWPSFRGPNASGIAEGYPTPARWSAETAENIKWKTPIPGMGHSSPKGRCSSAPKATSSPYLRKRQGRDLAGPQYAHGDTAHPFGRYQNGGSAQCRKVVETARRAVSTVHWL